MLFCTILKARLLRCSGVDTRAVDALAHAELAAPHSVDHVLALLEAYVVGPFMIG